MKSFRINVSGTKFFISKKNIQNDSPNLFTERFSLLPDKGPVYLRRIAVDRDPVTFKYIQKYLQGYDILQNFTSPLSQESKILVNDLISDAAFYKLQVLEEQLRRLVSFNECLLDQYKPLLDCDTDCSTELDSDSDDERGTMIKVYGNSDDFSDTSSDYDSLCEDCSICNGTMLLESMERGEVDRRNWYLLDLSDVSSYDDLKVKHE